MANIPPPAGGSVGGAIGGAAQPGSNSSSTTPAGPGAFGTSTSWHMVVLWFLGAVALIALADPAPQIATVLVLLIILGTLLNNWSVYKSYLGI